ncbi:MAG: hypothetical protein AB4372_10545 [Xenococcus sp. (in: cyanobacteria)]
MMTTQIILVFGYSGSGKTYFCDRVKELVGFESLHPIGWVKAQYENIYDLPNGFLDTTEGKRYVPEGMTITVNQVLIDLYHFWANRDPFYSTRGFLPILKGHLSQGNSVCINGIRNYQEILAIEELIRSSEVISTGIWLEGDRAIEKSSDKLQKQIFNHMETSYKFALVNDYSESRFDTLIETLFD